MRKPTFTAGLLVQACGVLGAEVIAQTWLFCHTTARLEAKLEVHLAPAAKFAGQLA